jgi:hypothetical protein
LRQQRRLQDGGDEHDGRERGTPAELKHIALPAPA